MATDDWLVAVDGAWSFVCLWVMCSAFITHRWVWLFPIRQQIRVDEMPWCSWGLANTCWHYHCGCFPAVLPYCVATQLQSRRSYLTNSGSFRSLYRWYWENHCLWQVPRCLCQGSWENAGEVISTMRSPLPVLCPKGMQSWRARTTSGGW